MVLLPSLCVWLRASMTSAWVSDASTTTTIETTRMTPVNKHHHHHRRRRQWTATKTVSMSSSSSSSKLYDNEGGGTEYERLQLHNPIERAIKQSSVVNEWGIPASRDLPRLPENHGGRGRVTLVGAGPGDPDLLTMAAYRLLTKSKTPNDEENTDTLVIADRLVSPEVLALVNVGPIQVARKLPGCADLAQEEIYWWAYQALAKGQHVIRLKIGDPFVFGRGGEEVLTFRRWGVEPTVLPGVSAAVAAPLLGNIPITHRGIANQVVLCTGYGREGSSPSLIQYHKEQTIVFLMAVGRLKELCSRLHEQAQYPIDTPVAIIEKAGWTRTHEQRTVTGTLQTIADIAAQHNIQPPSTIVVGEVVNVLMNKDENGRAVTGLIRNYAANAAAQVSSLSG